ncbi:FimV/HubP family polar landmark protein [Marinobacter orientalis]|uniref:FimV N-terminal domain-containing protein n=1 Tax=Marinobacter orientalis TaxID=1928859 RepID=A0A7Y0WSF1_9GAMM|nr:FimV/HubP family polar landmark protein [Marinobacter orientalis]NMT63731.1 hypothetical protein [Marinobacter orientalis]TGX49845.1 hypothetical protein DIT72_08995 [Marinobacter orientalis]
MKVRKLAVALALAGGLGSGVAQALGLGEIELQSYLNEPLDAEINLRKSEGVDPGDVFVNIAPDSAYERVGIDRNHFLTKLDFRVTTTPDGSLVVNVSSREPLREPYLNFLLEVTWPNGRLMREYAVLVDPPVYAEESGVQEQIAAPATREAAQPSRQQTQPRAQARSQAPQRTASERARSYGPTGPSDTLWNIAASVRPDNSVSMQQVMLALQDLNPDAFMGGNINRLKRGEVLRVPDIEDIRSRSRAEANRQVAVQNEALSSPERTVDATDEAADSRVASGQSGQGETGGDELRLLASDDTGSRDSAEGGSAGGDGSTAGGVDAGSAVAMEELESARRENEELTGRVDDLQEQVETLQRLLELKNTQIAEIQQAEAEAGGEQPVDAPDEETLAEQVAEDDIEAASGTDVAGADTDESDAAETGTETGVADGTATDQDAAPAEEDPAVDESVAEMSTAADESGEEAEVAAPAQQAEQEPAAPPAQPDSGFPGNVIGAITNNPMYQIALGGGLIVLLLLLLLLARRNANREKAFYDQLGGENENDSDTFNLTLDEEESAQGADSDPLAEADAYIAYGRMDQAAQSLETAISREPSRTDLRLKLLAVYADTQDRASFEKQMREVEALQDEQAVAQAHALQSRLEEAESMPSIDDLESQLRSDSFETGGVSSADNLSDELVSDRYESHSGEIEENEFGSLETDFAELDPDEPEAAGTETAGTEAKSDPDDLIEYDLSEIDVSGDEAEDLTDESFDFTLEDDFESGTETGEVDNLETDDSDEFGSLEIDEEDLATSVPDAGTAGSPAEELDSLDESFLDDLDAELDKVAGDDNTSVDSDGNELDDLELDVSDDDLALMDEFADTGDSAGTEGLDTGGVSAEAEAEAEEGAALFDREPGLENSLGSEEPDDPEATVAAVEAVEDEFPELSDEDLERAFEAGQSAGDAEEPPLASDSTLAGTSSGAADIDESELGDDDDFDFLSGTDEASTKLDLARAYVEMGDVDGARDILEEVALEGDEEQKAEAQGLLKNLS